MLENSNNSKISLKTLFQKPTDIVLISTVICYLIGFAISNIYLNSFGIVSFDVLRSRYILVGLLFIIFIGSIYFLVYGLMQTLKKNLDKNIIVIFGKAIWYSFENLSVLFLVITGITIFAGSTNHTPFEISGISTEISWLDWIKVESPNIVILSAKMFAIVIGTLILLFLVIILINPKDVHGNRTTRKFFFIDFLKRIKAKGGKGAIILIASPIYIFITFFITRFMSFLSFDNSSLNSFSVFNISGWLRYFCGIFVIYILIASYILIMILSIKDGENDNQPINKNPINYLSGKIIIITILIITIIPLYANGIYPFIPQQVGGGQLIFVTINVTDDSIQEIASYSNQTTYLIDKTNTSSLLLFTKNDFSSYKVIEIANSSIKSIQFNQNTNP